MKSLPPATGGPLQRPPCPYARRPWHSDSILHGTLVRGSGPSVYIVDLAGRHFINSAGTFNSCEYQWNDVKATPDSALNMMFNSSTVSGPPCPQSLVQPPGQSVYYFDNGFKKHIPGAGLFESCGYNWDQIVIVNPPSGSGQFDESAMTL